MKRRIKLRVLHLGMAGLLATVAGFSCVAHAPSGLAPTEVIIDERSGGSIISLHSGGRLVVILPGKPSTGFGWGLASGMDPVLVQQGEPVFTRSSKGIGAGGRYRFTFLAAACGKVPVRFVYRRPFEPGTPPAAIFEVTVEVGESERRK